MPKIAKARGQNRKDKPGESAKKRAENQFRRRKRDHDDDEDNTKEAGEAGDTSGISDWTRKNKDAKNIDHWSTAMNLELTGTIDPLEIEAEMSQAQPTSSTCESCQRHMWWGFWSRAVGPNRLHSISKYIRLQFFNQVWATRIDYFILLIIFINCIFMALEEEIMWVEYTATSIFIAEALFKMLAWGLWGKYRFPKPEGEDKKKMQENEMYDMYAEFVEEDSDSEADWKNGEDFDYDGYFNSGWNIFDFCIVIVSITIFFEIPGNVSGLRSLRILKPLRAMSLEARILVNTILNSFGKLMNVVLLLLFLFVIFAIAAVQLYAGVLHQRCFSYAPIFQEDAADFNAFLHFKFNDHWRDEYMDATWNDEPIMGELCNTLSEVHCTDPDDLTCQSSACSGDGGDRHYCLQLAPNPDEELIGFDNVLQGIVNVFWIISLEAWVNILYYLIRAVSWEVVPFFIVLTFIVSFFAMNLCLAVIEEMYSASVDDAEDEEEEQWDKVLFCEIYPEYRYLFEETRGDEEFANESADVQRRLPSFNAGPSSPGLASEKGTLRGSQLSMFNQMSTTEPDLPSGQVLSAEDYKSELQDSDKKAFDLLAKKENQGIEETKRRGKTNKVQVATRPDEARFRLYESRKMHFIIAKRAWEASEIPKNQYLEGKGPLIWILNHVVTHPWFSQFILWCVVLNTAVLACQWPDMPEDLEGKLEVANTGFMVLFFFEMVLKIAGLGFKDYISDNWNRFDAAIVCLSLGEFTYGLIAGSSGGSSLSVLRVLRVLRVMRMLQNPSMKLLGAAVLNSISDVLNLVVILLVFLFMFGILGIELFGNKWKEFEDAGSEFRGQWSFGRGFYWSFLTVFQVITGDAWNDIMSDAVMVTSQWSVLFFFSAVCFGSFVLLNIFIAILLAQMGAQDHTQWMKDEALKHAEWLRLEDQPETENPTRTQVKTLIGVVTRRDISNSYKKNKHIWKASSKSKLALHGLSFGVFDRNSKIRLFCHEVTNTVAFGIFIDVLIIINCVFLAWENPTNEDKSVFRTMDIIFTIIFLGEMILKMVARGVFPTPFFADHQWTQIHPDGQDFDNHLSRCQAEVKHMCEEDDTRVWWEGDENIMYKIMESEDGWKVIHFQKTEQMRLVFEKSEFRTAYIMNEKSNGGYEWEAWPLGEDLPDERHDVVTVCKSNDCNNVNTNSYMSSNWDRLDAFVVFASVVCIIWPSFPAFRALRAIRPLRIAIAIKQVKIVMTALVKAIPGVLTVLGFCFMFWFVLAVLGVFFFSGKLFACECTYPEGFEECNLTDAAGETVKYGDFGKEECNAYDGDIEWTNFTFNFDNVFYGIHTLFVVATLSGWNDVMFRCVDSTGEDTAPEAYHTPIVGIYFIFIIILCSFFSLNLIISIVVEHFSRIKGETEGSAFLTAQQMAWRRNLELVNRIGLTRQLREPPKENYYPNYYLYHIAEHRFFEAIILSCIMLNVCIMAMEKYDMSDGLILFLWAADLIFVIIFAFEAFAKIGAYTFPIYIEDGWNKFDLLIVVSGFFSLFLDINLNVFRLIRFFRILRVMRLVKFAKSLKILFMTLIFAAPALWNIGMLIFIIFFIYAVIGVNTLGDKGCGFMPDGETEEEEAIQCVDDADLANFKSFGFAMITLYRVATEDGWTDLYASYMTMDTIVEANMTWWVCLYFVSFFILGTMVLVNLFIGVILEVYDYQQEMEGWEDIIYTVKDFREQWKEYDPDASRRVSTKHFVDILKKSPAPAGFCKGGETYADVSDYDVLEYLNDLLLLTSIEAEDMTAKKWFTGFWKLVGRVKRFWVEERFEEDQAAPELQTIDSTKAKELETEDYLLEFDSVVLAISTKILRDCYRVTNGKKGEMFQIFVTPEDDMLFIRDWYIQVDGQRRGERERRMRMLHDINVEKKLELTRRQAELARSKAIIGADTDDEEFECNAV